MLSNYEYWILCYKRTYIYLFHFPVVTSLNRHKLHLACTFKTVPVIVFIQIAILNGCKLHGMTSACAEMSPGYFSTPRFCLTMHLFNNNIYVALPADIAVDGLCATIRRSREQTGTTAAQAGKATVATSVSGSCSSVILDSLNRQSVGCGSTPRRQSGHIYGFCFVNPRDH